VGETLRTMKFRLRTAMGDSTEYYTHNENTPIHGVSQGGTASPAFWLLVSSALFDCYQQKDQGMPMIDPTGTIKLRQWLEALVDSTSVFTNTPDFESLPNLVQHLEKDALYWENLLSVSRGCLELSKCFYYLLAWTFTNTGYPIPMTLAEMELEVAAVQLQEFSKTVPANIKQQAPEIAHKTLGVWKSMIDDDTVHIKHLKQRSANMASTVLTSCSQPYQAEVSVRMIYSTAMGYSLPSVTRSEKITNKIQAKALESFVPALGYNRGFPRDILLGPYDFGSASIPHLYTESKIQLLEILLTNIRAQTDLGKLFMINLNWIQILAGIDEPYLNSTQEISYINNWFTGIKLFLNQSNGRIEFRSLSVPVVERSGDQCIMNAFADIRPKLSKNQIGYCNSWRVYYNVILVSDICNAKGDEVLEKYLTDPNVSPFDHLLTPRTRKTS
jgi:hypothetical protein